MISFRLTAEEYERFLELCYSQGIRSVSEMARAAINMMFAQPEKAPEGALEVRVAELEGRFRLLALEVKRLSQQAPQSVAGASSAGSR